LNTVFIVPTGIGCSIGGHAGDATPAFKLIASVSDIAITHPNVVNASDINEMPSNALYVEGSILDRFLEGRFGLKRVRSNRILLVSNENHPDTINMMNAAKVTLGADIRHLVLDKPLEMVATKKEDGSGCFSVLRPSSSQLHYGIPTAWYLRSPRMNAGTSGSGLTPYNAGLTW